MRRGLLLIAFVLTVTCSPGNPEPDTDGTWVGTITAEGNVTTVINESGSVWGGSATLIEEMSIGVEAGADEYMFGDIDWVHAESGKIWVVDRQVPAVRAYDREGVYLGDVGREGQGPGEYTRPQLVAATSDGRILVVDQGTRRINVYSPDGAPLADTYPLGRRVAFGYGPLAVDADDVPWLAYQDPDPTVSFARYVYSFSAHGAEGVTSTRTLPEVDFDPVELRFDGKAVTVPFGPTLSWNLAPSGAVLVGATDRYRFEVHEADGRRTIVEKRWDRFPVTEQEAAYFTDLWIRQGLAPAGWNGDEIPDHKPAFLRPLGAATGEIWLLRPGRGFRIPECDEPGNTLMCWQNRVFYDVFEQSGRFLGRVDIPEEMRVPLMSTPPHFDGDRVVAVAMDDAGVLRVKRYRLDLPGETDPR